MSDDPKLEEFMDSDDDADTPVTEDAKVGEPKDISGDGGLIKTITTAGTGWNHPPKGCEVTVHYTGTLEDGSVFDSSRDRNEPFVFKIGEGQVIKGWDKGVATMKKGERAVLKCRADYAYGERGSPPKIPANATLNFDVELISWTEWKVVGDAKDGIVKQIVTEGKDWKNPKFDAHCVFGWKAFEDQDEKFATPLGGKDEDLIIGAGQVSAGIEKCLESMKQGETARFRLPAASIAQDTEANKISTSSEIIQLEISLQSFENPKDSWEAKGAEKLELAKQKKDEGSEAFQRGAIERATKKYQLALTYLNSDHDLPNKDDAKPLKLSVHLNLAACDLKRNNWKGVIDHCNKALDVDRASLKAKLRRGKAYNELDLWTEAKQDLQDVLDVQGAAETADAKREMARLAAKIKTQNEKEKHLFSNMFDRMRELKPEDKVKEAAPKAEDPPAAAEA